MYGRTNKHNTTRQIGCRVKRLEQARLAADRQKMKKQSKRAMVGLDEGMVPNLDIQYQMSNSRSDPVDIFGHVYANQSDPALTVCPPGLLQCFAGQLIQVKTGIHSQIKRPHTQMSS
jgi:hypothetical protein